MSVPSLYSNYLKCQAEFHEVREKFSLKNVSREILEKMKISFDNFLKITEEMKKSFSDNNKDYSGEFGSCIIYDLVAEKERELILLQGKQALLSSDHISERLKIERSIEEQMYEPMSATEWIEGEQRWSNEPILAFANDEGFKAILGISGLFNIISSYMAHPAVATALAHVVRKEFYPANDLIRSQKSGVMDYLILEPLATDLEKSAAVEKLTNQLREISIIENLENREFPLENFKIIESRNIIRLFVILVEIYKSEFAEEFEEEFKVSLEKINLEGKFRELFFSNLHSADLLLSGLDSCSDAILIADQINEWMKQEESARFLNGITDLRITTDSSMIAPPMTLLPRCIDLLKNLEKLSFSLEGDGAELYMEDPDEQSREFARSLRLLPNSIGKLTNLKVIELKKAGLLGLPCSIGAMRKLTKIIIENDKPLLLPSSIGNLTDLEKLDLACQKPENKEILYSQNSS
ncbi:MAG: hypothetical protein V4487_02200, partial [Chlamydiota bacterium]